LNYLFTKGYSEDSPQVPKIPDGATEYLDVVLKPGAQLRPVGEVIHQQDLLQQLARGPEAITYKARSKLVPLLVQRCNVTTAGLGYLEVKVI
jgi:hypothetical protein